MAASELKRVIQALRGATMAHEEANLTDGQLLESYVGSREEAALAALVCRHGPMVWGVCRRVLGSHHDAEDAFQATFLVLVRKASSIVPRELVANWLYGVAQQTALKARATTARRRGREKQVPTMPEPAAQQQQRQDDLCALLDQELSRLPDKYRAVIVLCDLQGKTRKEAARHFALPEGTVASRLATARAMLAKRLTRQGLRVSSGALALVLAEKAASASVPLAVTTSTIKAASLFAAGQATAPGMISVKAVALAEGVLGTMLLTKLKIATAMLLALVVLGAGAVVLAQRRLADRSGNPPRQPMQALAEKPADQPVKDGARPADQPVKAKAEKNGDAPAAPPVGCGNGGALVKAVDVAANTITFDDKAPAVVAGKTFRVAPHASITIDGKPGKLAELPPGAFLHLNLSADQKMILNFRAAGPELSCFDWARVEAVNAEKNTVTFDDKAPALVARKTFAVGGDARIVIDGKPGKLTELPPGAFLNLGLSVNRTTILHFTARGPELSCFEPGRIEAIDVEKGTVTFDDKAPALVVGKTFAVARDARIEIDGKRGKLADLLPGAFLHLGLSADAKTIVHFTAQGPQVSDCNGSQVKAVDVSKSTITFDDKARAEVAGKTFRVFADANVHVDGKRAKLTELPAGAFVNLTLSMDQKSILRLDASGPQVSDCNGSQVKAVDVSKSTITFDDKARAEVAGKTFRIADDASINVDGKRGKLADLPAGAFVNVGLAVDRRTIRHLSAFGPQVSDCNGSLVKAVDVSKSTITFDDKARAEVAGKTFRIADDASINIDGKRGKLAELPVAAFVNLGLCVDRKTINHVQAQGPQLGGPQAALVKAVDAKKNTVTFDDKAPALVAGKTFAVARDARIEIDGKRGKLADLPPGAFLSLGLSVDRKTIVYFTAQGPQVR